MLQGMTAAFRHGLVAVAFAVVLTAPDPALAAGTSARGSSPGVPSITIPLIERAVTVDEFVPALTDSGFSTPLCHVHELVQRSPVEGAPVSERTDVYLGRDERTLYVVFVCFDREMARTRSRLVGRDRIPDDDDNVAINIDTFHDRQHAYGFELNAAGVQLDGLYSESGGWDFSYDMVWSSGTRRTPQGYVALFAIPFNAMRFTPGNPDGWGLLLYRGIPRKNEDATWPLFSTKIAGRMRQAGDVRGLDGVTPGGTTQFVPYGSFLSGRSLDLREPARPHFTSDRQGQSGVDAKFTVHNSVVVDATYNPDFSQVESDQPRETLNQRFEVFFPELRPFFLENASYFNTPLTLVFTRRIADPQAGGRVTGRLGSYAFGALASDDRSPGETGQPGASAGDRAYFSALRVSRDIGPDDNVGMIFTGRTAPGVANAVGGFDGRFTFARCWTASAQTVTSLTDESGTRRAGQASEVALLRTGRQLKWALQYDDFDPTFRSDVGFINRLDVRYAGSTLSYRVRPEGKWLIAWGPDFGLERFWDHHGLRVGATCSPQLTFELARGTALTVFHRFASEVLRPADVANLAENRSFGEGATGFSFASSVFARCVMSAALSAGGGIDLLPPAGSAPEAARVTNASTTLSVRATNALTLDGTCILTRVRDPLVRADHFDESLVRAVATYQFTPATSIRVIGRFHGLMPNATFTSAQRTEQLTSDFLFTYLLHPYTAVYVGYTDDRQNLDPALRPTPDGIARTRSSLLNDGRQLFVKVSCLLRR